MPQHPTFAGILACAFAAQQAQQQALEQAQREEQQAQQQAQLAAQQAQQQALEQAQREEQQRVQQQLQSPMPEQPTQELTPAELQEQQLTRQQLQVQSLVAEGVQQQTLQPQDPSGDTSEELRDRQRAHVEAATWPLGDPSAVARAARRAESAPYPPPQALGAALCTMVDVPSDSDEGEQQTPTQQQAADDSLRSALGDVAVAIDAYGGSADAAASGGR